MRTRVRSDGWWVPLSYLLSFDCRIPSRLSSSRCVQPRSSRSSRRRAPMALLKTLGCGLGLARGGEVPSDEVASLDDFSIKEIMDGWQTRSQQTVIFVCSGGSSY